MNKRIKQRLAWPRCGPPTTLLWVLSLAGWVLLSIAPVNSRLRPEFWAMALTGLALGCTRIALQGQLRMCLRFDRSTAEAVRRAHDEGRAEAEDRLCNSELVDRITAAALHRLTATTLPDHDPDPGARNAPPHTHPPTFDPCAETLSSIGIQPRLHRTA